MAEIATADIGKKEGRNESPMEEGTDCIEGRGLQTPKPKDQTSSARPHASITVREWYGLGKGGLDASVEKRASSGRKRIIDCGEQKMWPRKNPGGRRQKGRSNQASGGGYRKN